MTKEEFIANYLNKSRRLKNHNLPYGMEYLSLVSKVEEDAEKAWIRFSGGKVFYEKADKSITIKT
jgi:hypothetical protein